MAKQKIKFTGTVSDKGWVVIPKELRELLGLKKGSKVDIVYYGGGLFIEPEDESDPIDATDGMFQGGTSLLDTYRQYKREEEAIDEAKQAYWDGVNQKKNGKLRL